MLGIAFLVGCLFGLFSAWASGNGKRFFPEHTIIRAWVWLAAWANARLAGRRQFETVFKTTYQQLAEMNDLAYLVTDRETCRMVQEMITASSQEQA